MFWFMVQVDSIQSYLNFKIGLPPVPKAGSSYLDICLGQCESSSDSRDAIYKIITPLFLRSSGSRFKTTTLYALVSFSFQVDILRITKANFHIKFK
jgi:hypothetical protein